MSYSCKTQKGQGAEQVGSRVEAQGDRRRLWEEVKAGQEPSSTQPAWLKDQDLGGPQKPRYRKPKRGCDVAA